MCKLFLESVPKINPYTNTKRNIHTKTATHIFEELVITPY